MWKKLLMAAGLTAVLFLTACAVGNEKSGEESLQENEAQDEARKEAGSGEQKGHPGEAPAELEGELTILSWDPRAEFSWEAIIEGFTKEHPKVTVTVDCPEEMDIYLRSYATKIMSGKGYDIVQEADFASAQKGWEETGLFVDLYEFMDSDEDFHREDYFSSIYEPMETDGKLFRFLRNVSPVYIRMNKRLLEQAGVEYTEETISFDELYEIYEKVREKCGEKIVLTEEGNYEPLGVYEGSYYTRNNLLDTDEYEEYLRMNHEMYYEAEDRTVYGETGQGIAEDALCRILGVNSNCISLVNEIFKGTEDFTPAILYVSTHGEHYFRSTNSLSISSSSENRELAWEFLKYVVGNYDVDYRDAGFLPPNKERTMALCGGLEPEVRERLFRDIEAVNTAQVMNLDLEYNLDSVREDYYLNNTLTAEECRKELASRVYLYMNE